MECQRCGNCCRKGPPCLHLADKGIYSSGIIEKNHLITFRKGEIVYDNIKEQKVCLPEEMVRLRTEEDQTACLFFDASSNACSIYPNRPLECRVLRCWDTKEIVDIYNKDRLKRLDLVPPKSALGQIIQEHEKNCSIEYIREILGKIKISADNKIKQSLSNILFIDRTFREYLQKEAGVNKDTNNFLFGRSVIDILASFGVEIKETEQRIRIVDYSNL